MTGDSVQFQCFDDVITLVRGIVADAKSLCDEHLEERDLPVNYAAIFTQSEEEYQTIGRLIQLNGQVVEETPTGNVYKVPTFLTAAGTLRLVKVRRPDESRTERGDADFTVKPFQQFKNAVLGRQGFRLISRDDYEMIELHVSGAPARAYFSNPTLEQQYFAETEPNDAT